MPTNTKKKLLQAALKLFAKQGIDKTSTAQITKAVGVSEGALFVHFKTKQELVDTLYMNIKTAACSNLAEVIDEAASVEVNVKNIARVMIEHYAKHYEDFVFIEIIEIDPQVSKTTLKKAKALYENITKAVLAWQKAGHLKQLEPDVLGTVFWNTVMVFIRQTKRQKVKQPPAEWLDVVWDAVKK